MIASLITNNIVDEHVDSEHVLKESKTATLFQTPEYLSGWSLFFLPDKNEILKIIVTENEKPIGIGIFRRQNNRLTFLGTDQIGDNHDLVTDFGDIVAVLGKEQTVWQEIIKEAKAHGIQEMVLDYVREFSPSFEVLKALGFVVSEMIDHGQPDPAPFIDLPKIFDEYLLKLKRKERHEFKRKLRRLESETYQIVVSQNPNLDIDEFIRLHKASTGDKDRFMTKKMEGFFKQIVRVLSPKGLIDLLFMQIDGKNVSSIISFVWQNEYWLYNSGFDRDYTNLAVGFLLKALSVKYAIAKGYKRYNFLRGNERYKYDLGAKDERLYKMKINF
jgi:CelD/BcsL family acetyltransferase involved in cellulose biosynthesis